MQEIEYEAERGRDNTQCIRDSFRCDASVASCTEAVTRAQHGTHYEHQTQVQRLGTGLESLGERCTGGGFG